jgi:hypothetical protein
MATKTQEQPLVFNIVLPEQKVWNKDEGRWEKPILYSTPAWVKYHGVLPVLDGHTVTDDIKIAMELMDMGATVTPDPRPIMQERYAASLKAEAENNPVRLWELAKYVNETNAWRAEHGVKPLSIEAPNVGRPVSALVMTNVG